MPERVFVVGVGMTRFCKPQKGPDPSAPKPGDFARIAVQRALDDACLSYKEVQAAAVGCMFSHRGQEALYQMGMTGIPIFNVANACATGSNALYLCRSFIAGGAQECALALGIEIMQPGPLGGVADPGKKKAASGPPKPPAYPDAPKQGNGMTRGIQAMVTKYPIVKAPLNPQMFGNAGREHNIQYGSTPEHFAKIGEKNHRHSANNPYSQFREVYSLDEVKAAPMIYEPLTKLQCSPTSDGAACAILASEAFVKRHGLEGQAVEIIAQSMKTDYPSVDVGSDTRSCINAVGAEMAKEAADDVYKQSGLGPKDVQVIELHDCFAPNELITYEALGLAEQGQGHKLVDVGDVTYGGRWVVNPSGGLISKGHPLGATGLAQCCELNWQLRREAGPRQVPDAQVALQHNLGLGGCVVITMYKRPAEFAGKAPKRRTSGGMGFPEMASKL
uniref:propanoyl-CoA C-acyltransferase n=1 Tax=Alexandrium catenella TaxID=2925 RepID=A0A7S1LNZ0_ALECA